MTTKKLQSTSFEKLMFTSFDDEVLELWTERTRIQLSFMGEIAAYLD
ncbi:hypothetical protein [Halomonas sp. LBP4]|nr:hypothetical protein [Halomonas sp. LBP4]